MYAINYYVGFRIKWMKSVSKSHKIIKRNCLARALKLKNIYLESKNEIRYRSFKFRCMRYVNLNSES